MDLEGASDSASRRNVRDSINPEFIDTATFVPVPPSRVAQDPLYDDRLVRVLRLLGDDVDIRELVFQVEGMHDTHTAECRPGPGALYQNYGIDNSMTEPEPTTIVVFDDVLTTGAHFKAMKQILHETFEEATIIGLFLCRRVPDTE